MEGQDTYDHLHDTKNNDKINKNKKKNNNISQNRTIREETIIRLDDLTPVNDDDNNIRFIDLAREAAIRRTILGIIISIILMSLYIKFLT